MFRNNAGQLGVAKNFPPTKDILKETVEYYKKVATQKGYKVGNKTGELGDEVFERLVRQTWESATMDKGFITASKVTAERNTARTTGAPITFTAEQQVLVQLLQEQQ